VLTSAAPPAAEAETLAAGGNLLHDTPAMAGTRVKPRRPEKQPEIKACAWFGRVTMRDGLICTRQWFFLTEPREWLHPARRSEGRNDRCCSSGKGAGRREISHGPRQGSDQSKLLTGKPRACSRAGRGRDEVPRRQRNPLLVCAGEQGAAGSAAPGEPCRLRRRDRRI